MARIRTIKPDFFQSEDNINLSYRARLTWIALWTYVDDDGRCKDNPRLIKGHAWPLEDDVTAAEVEKDLAELHERDRIIRYEVNGERLLEIRKWRDHQRIAKPTRSKLPPSPVSVSHHSEPLSNPSEPTPEEYHTPTTPLPVGKEVEVEVEGKSDPGKPDTRTPEHRATDDAYNKTGKAFNFIATRQIAKWAIADRGKSEAQVSQAIVATYEAGKPITKSTIGQYLDGITRGAPLPDGKAPVPNAYGWFN